MLSQRSWKGTSDQQKTIPRICSISFVKFAVPLFLTKNAPPAPTADGTAAPGLKKEKPLQFLDFKNEFSVN
jgi:hypothetical protein